MDKALLSAMQFNQILDLIEPAGESGKHFRHHLSGYKTGQENELRKEYKRLELLIAAITKDRRFAAQMTAALAEIPWLPHTLKTLTERPLLLHECFEIKKLVHYGRILQQLCSSHKLDKVYPFPDLEILSAMLDPDRTNSPAFALSPAFDSKLAKYIARLQDLQLDRRQQEARLLKEAQKAVGLNKPAAEIVISRLQEKERHKLQKSGFYTLADENFANLTFRLKDTDKLAVVKKEISALTNKLAKVEEEVLLKLSKKLKTFAKTLRQTADLVQQLDWDHAKAAFALKYDCCLPVLTSKTRLTVSQAANLPVKLNLTSQKRKYQPLDLRFSSALNVLTGPNMGGKTTALKTIGQLCLLTRHAIPLPAQSAELCLFDHIWFNHEARETENLSSFGREIVSLAAALNRKGRNLFLFDELAKGTNPREGEALLTAVLQYLSEQPCLTIAATHFDGPAQLRNTAQFAIKGLDLKAMKKLAKTDKATLDEQLDLLNNLMDYNPVRLSTKENPPQNAIPIARTLGLSEDIIRLAENLLTGK